MASKTQGLCFSSNSITISKEAGLLNLLLAPHGPGFISCGHRMAERTPPTQHPTSPGTQRHQAFRSHALSGFMTGKSCWLLLEGQISLRFMGCMGSDGDLNRNLSTVWKGQVERMPHGHPAMSRRGGTPRAPYPPSPGLF